MMQRGTLLQEMKKVLARAGVENPALDSRLLLCHVLGISHEDLIRDPEEPMAPQEEKEIRALCARRAEREPVSHLLGQREFYGFNFRVTGDVLDPRPDSETLIEVVREAFPDSQAPLSILDLGTGSGCLLLTLLALYPHAKGTGVDISRKALEIAAANAKALGVDKRTVLKEGDWLKGAKERVDVIISNPPYIPQGDIGALAPEVRLFEPHGALVGGTDGLDCYRAIIPAAEASLKPSGLLLFECGDGQAPVLEAMVAKEGYKDIRTHADLAGKGRAVSARQASLPR
jgi:release factor glutamine methyltransferase